MKIAAAQIACTLGDLPENLSKLRDFAGRAKAAGAGLVVFPEMADTGYAMRVIRENAQPWSQCAVPGLQAIARSLSLTIISGVSERADDCIYNAQVVIDANGAVAAKYRKTHLFAPAPIEEDKCCTPGAGLTSWSLGPLRFGLGICYDLRFPEFHRTLAVEEKANVFVISSAWPFPRVEHLRILATARAIENQSYVILSNRVGTDDGVKFCGTSVVIDPSGMILAEASTDHEELIVAEVSAAIIQLVREAMPVFAHRRADLYAPARREEN
ncbi:MAG: nitrilase-related carbon-nitrogen hydrolase [Spartobacteria bacterium]